MPLGYIFSPIFTLDFEMGSHEAAHAGLGFTVNCGSGLGFTIPPQPPQKLGLLHTQHPDEH